MNAAFMFAGNPEKGRRARVLEGALAGMAQLVVGQDQGGHGLAHRYRTDADAGIVAAAGLDLGLGKVAIEGAARDADRGGRLDREADHQVLSGGNAAEHAAIVVRQEDRPVFAGTHLVGRRLAAQGGGGEAAPISTPLTALIVIIAMARSLSSLP